MAESANITPSQAPNPDARLLVLCATISEIDQESNRLYDMCDEFPLSHPACAPYNAHTLATMPIWDAAIAEITATPATTAVGLQAKATVAFRQLDEDGKPPDHEVAWSLCRDILAGSTTP